MNAKNITTTTSGAGAQDLSTDSPVSQNDPAVSPRRARAATLNGFNCRKGWSAVGISRAKCKAIQGSGERDGKTSAEGTLRAADGHGGASEAQRTAGDPQEMMSIPITVGMMGAAEEGSSTTEIEQLP